MATNYLALPNVKIWYIPYKMKIWRRIYFGGLANYENPPNLIPLSSFLLPNACKIQQRSPI